MPKKQEPTRKIITQNRKARYNYSIDDTVEAGIMLVGSEIKSLRHGDVSIDESWAGFKDGVLYLFNAYIKEFKQASYTNHDPKRPRILLLHKKESSKLFEKTCQKGATIVPLKMYFNRRGIAKVELGIATGKKQHDKRHTIKERDWNREKQRLLRDYNKSQL